MKKAGFIKKAAIAAAALLPIVASAQTKGKFEVYDFNEFKLHVYYTNDAMGDARSRLSPTIILAAQATTPTQCQKACLNL